jgi:hypothetical protein
VEKRSVANLALVMSGAVVLVAVAVLVVKVKSGSSASAVDPVELDRASRLATQAPVPAAAEPPVPSIPAPSARPAFEGAAQRARVAGLERVRPDEPRAPAPPTAQPEQPRPPRIEAAITEAIESYDRAEYENARSMAMQALNLLAESDPPMADRMLRIAASSSCYIGDAEKARALHGQLTPKSQIDVEKRCRRVGVVLR